jgi:hypothetical protein
LFFTALFSCDVKKGSQTMCLQNEFLNLEGNKLSTLWVWFVARFGGFSASVTTSNAPETKDNDFT